MEDNYDLALFSYLHNFATVQCMSPREDGYPGAVGLSLWTYCPHSLLSKACQLHGLFPHSLLVVLISAFIQVTTLYYRTCFCFQNDSQKNNYIITKESSHLLLLPLVASASGLWLHLHRCEILSTERPPKVVTSRSLPYLRSSLPPSYFFLLVYASYLSRLLKKSVSFSKLSTM